MSRHRSTAYIGAFPAPTWRHVPVATDQFRFVLRLAMACHESGTEYDVTWNLANGRMAATITASGTIPATRPFPKAPKAVVAAKWSPKVWESEYRLDAIVTGSAGDKRAAAFVIPHSSGLWLTLKTTTGEFGTCEGDADPKGDWNVTHAASGMFICSGKLAKAAGYLAHLATFAVDWTLDAGALRQQPEFLEAMRDAYEFRGERQRVHDINRQIEKRDADSMAVAA